MASADNKMAFEGIGKTHMGGANDDDRTWATNVTTGGDITMRTTLLAMLVAAAIGLAGTSGVSAVPVNGAVIGDLANATDSVAQVQWGHWRSGSRGGHWRWGSRGGHWRWGSRGGRRY